ncbi:MAG TPA: hypothetical protein VFL58_06060 [Gaiellaceae bacterium]|nr:hypothetical protein [Gaiellaceae bacterium]
MKLRELLRRFRLPSLEIGEGVRAGEDNVDALASGISPGHGDTGAGNVPALAPPNWVPSQQDERPLH